MRAYELYEYLEKLIPAELSCDWDNDGLMCAAGAENEVRRVLLTLDVTDKAVEYAVARGCGVIISHHPLIFRPLKTLALPKLMTLVKNDITVMSFHTRLDSVDGGVNDALAARLSLKNVTRYGELARLGALEAECDLYAFAAIVRDALGAPYVNTVGQGRVRRVMVVGGDGKDYYRDASAAKADVYVTGAMSYNTLADAAEENTAVIEAGHYYTEQPVLHALGRMICAAAPDIGLFTFESNPVNVI